MPLKFITPTIHGVLDYSAALMLIVAPIILQLNQHSPLVYWFSITAGGGLIIYSLLTDYKLSLMNFFSFQTHLLLDKIAALAFIIMSTLQTENILLFAYCLIMGIGVIIVITFSTK
jgi:hypothetical protein